MTITPETLRKEADADEANPPDAPPWHSSEAASAWESGYLSGYRSALRDIARRMEEQAAASRDQA